MTPRMLNSGYSGKDPGFQNMIVLSVIIHLVVITIVLVSVPTTSRHLTFGPVYSVALVGPEVAVSRTRESSLTKEIEKSTEAASAIIFKREINRLAATPVKKEETNRVSIEKAISAIKQKELAKPEKSTSAKSVSGTTATAGTKNPESETSSQTTEYIGVVWSKIKKNWTLPPTLIPKDNIETIIAVRIARSGALEFINIEKRSGNSYFDDAALKTVKKSSPFPPFPSRLTDSSIEIGIRFHPSQFR